MRPLFAFRPLIRFYFIYETVCQYYSFGSVFDKIRQYDSVKALLYFEQALAIDREMDYQKSKKVYKNYYLVDYKK